MNKNHDFFFISELLANRGNTVDMKIIFCCISILLNKQKTDKLNILLLFLVVLEPDHQLQSSYLPKLQPQPLSPSAAGLGPETSGPATALPCTLQI